MVNAMDLSDANVDDDDIDADYDMEDDDLDDNGRIYHDPVSLQEQIDARKKRIREIRAENWRIDAKLLHETPDEAVLNAFLQEKSARVSDIFRGRYENNYLNTLPAEISTLLGGQTEPANPYQYILLSYLRETLSSEAYSAMVRESTNEEWVRNGGDVHFKDVYLSPHVKESEYVELRLLYQAIYTLGDGICDDTNTDLSVRAAWYEIDLVFHFLQYIFTMMRFLDSRNPETNVEPIADGTNLEHPALRMSWMMHRNWIEALHFRGLNLGDDNPFGFRQILGHIPLNLGFRAEEISLCGGESRTVSEKFQPLLSIAVQVEDALRNLGRHLLVDRDIPLTEPLKDTAFSRIRTDPNQRLIFQANIRDNDYVVEGYKQYIYSLSPMWKLLFKLCWLAHDFETTMRVEYVEDTLINKRVVLFDERHKLAAAIEDAESTAPGSAPLLGWASAEEYEKLFRHAPSIATHEYLFAVLRRVQEIQKWRRNFLLLHDWNKKRPWNVLYYVFDTSDDSISKDLLEPINNQFYGHLDWLKTLDNADTNYSARSPSRPSNIWAGLFPIHPIASTDLPENVKKFWDNGCVWCSEPFGINELLIELHGCEHLCHYVCQRAAWDEEGIHRFLCPYCRESAHTHRLAQSAGVIPEVEDVYDILQVVEAGEYGSAKYEEYRDISTQPADEFHTSHYWYEENNRIELSDRWDYDMPERKRKVDIEMAKVRQIRRARNKARRDEFRAAGTSIDKLTRIEDFMPETYDEILALKDSSDSSDSPGSPDSSSSDGVGAL